MVYKGASGRKQRVLFSNPRFVELCDASVAGLKERPHEDRALAALDVKQYRYTIKTFKMVKTEKKGLKLHESVDNVEERDFNAMGLALSGGPQTKVITVGVRRVRMRNCTSLI